MLPLVQKSRTGELKLILASGSARRKALFETLGFKFEAIQSNFPENLDKTLFSTEIDYVQATCKGKIEALPPLPVKDVNTIQIACDTVVIRPDGTILEKPNDHIEAFNMIKSLLGKKVKVVSVVYMRGSCDKLSHFCEETTLEMRDLDEIDDVIIEGYLNDTDLAGGLAIQSSGMIFVKSISGCYHNVMGFPMSKFYQELSKFIQ